MATYPLHEFSKFPLYPDFPQPPTGFPTRQTLDIAEVKYEAPNFVSTHATPKILADALDLEFKNLGPLEGIEYPDLLAPEMEITVPTMTVKSQATDEAGIASDIVAEVKRELVKSANLFAQLHRMNYEKTGQWPEWYNERWAPIYRKAVLWEAEFVHHEDPFAALPPDLRGEDGEYSEDRSNLLLAQLLMRTGETHQLEALKQRMGWEDEFVDKLGQELKGFAAREAAEAEAPQEPGLFDKIAEVAKEGLEQVLGALGPEEAGARELGEEDLESAENVNRIVAELAETGNASADQQAAAEALRSRLDGLTLAQLNRLEKAIVSSNRPLSESALILSEIRKRQELLRDDKGMADDTELRYDENLASLLEECTYTDFTGDDKNKALDWLHEWEGDGGNAGSQQAQDEEAPERKLEFRPNENGVLEVFVKLAEGEPAAWVNVSDVYIEYQDNKGFWTIGRGLKVDDTDWFDEDDLKTRRRWNKGRLVITREEAAEKFEAAITKFERELNRQYPWWRGLSGPRKAAVFSLMYNLGPDKFAEFKKFIAAMENGDFKNAFRELLDADRTSDVKGRVTQEAMLILLGQWDVNGKSFPKTHVETREAGIAWGRDRLKERTADCKPALGGLDRETPPAAVK